MTKRLSESGNASNIEVLESIIPNAIIHDWRCFNCHEECPRNRSELKFCPHDTKVVEFCYVSCKYVWFIQIAKDGMTVWKYDRWFLNDKLPLLLQADFPPDSEEYQYVLKYVDTLPPKDGDL
ncbi:MAG: hypothetical protein B9J98_08140 [Candidatus Terraquivivens tikiterensis]|uniref:Uncharacterized protein n=1 Tax=Candidatus Terraquivivens tikiterensis TaxID=1980982 RepID=A0A2R7Y0J1_9ARCH|nr:MAG: hypothetical protein B9J98_08140 [Candidatus Terraquivivens tikiterensis]